MDRQRLSVAQAKQLDNALKRDWNSYVLAQRPFQVDAGKHFTQMLGFPVTEFNVASAVKRIGQGWPRGRVQADVPAAPIVETPPPIAKVPEKQRPPLSQVMQSIVESQVYILKELGIKVPQDLEDYLK